MNPSGATDINYGIADDLSQSTSDDIWRAIEEEENVYPPVNRLNSFPRQPIQMARNDTSFEDSDLLELTVPDNEINFDKKAAFFIASTSWGKPERIFQVSNRSEPSPHHPYFFPDFFNIKKWTSYVFQTATFIPELYEETRESIPITIAPQVVLKANEENLIEDLETSVNLVQESYSTLRGIHVDIEHDPEIADMETIQFTLIVSGDPETILKDEALFKQQLRSNIDRRARELITVTYKWEE